MKLRQIEYVVRLADTLSFREAAEQCNAAQPTLSNGVASLEDELGARLFERTTREVSLTAFGRHVLPHLRAILADRDDLFQSVRQFNNPDHKILRIGMSPLLDIKSLERALAPFRNAHKDVEIIFKECLVDDLTERLHGDKLDIGLRVRDQLPEGLSAEPAYTEQLCYLPQVTDGEPPMVRKWRLKDLPPAKIICTNGACGLNGALLRLMQSKGTELNIYPGFALSYHVIEEWTELGIGAAILPESKISSTNMTAGPLTLNDDAPAKFDYEWIFKTAKLSSTPDYIAAFRDHITNIAPALLRA